MKDSRCPVCKAEVPIDRMAHGFVVCPSCERTLRMNQWLWRSFWLAGIIPGYFIGVSTGLREWPFIGVVVGFTIVVKEFLQFAFRSLFSIPLEFKPHQPWSRQSIHDDDESKTT